MARRRVLVRYISPFGMPAWMSEAEAEAHRVHDDARYLALAAAAALSEPQRQIGAPRIVRRVGR